MGVFENARRGPRTGGDAVREHIRNVTGSDDAYVFAYRSLEVHAYVVAKPVPHVLYTTFGVSRVASSQPSAGTQTELTMRVPGAPALPQQWPADVLARAAGDEIEPLSLIHISEPTRRS